MNTKLHSMCALLSIIVFTTAIHTIASEKKTTYDSSVQPATNIVKFVRVLNDTPSPSEEVHFSYYDNKSSQWISEKAITDADGAAYFQAPVEEDGRSAIFAFALTEDGLKGFIANIENKKSIAFRVKTISDQGFLELQIDEETMTILEGSVWISEFEGKSSSPQKYINDKRQPVAQKTNTILTDQAYQISIPHGWTRAEILPYGIDVGFRKKMKDGDYATFYFHHEVMPVEATEPPSDTSDMKRQWDAVVENQYPDARSVAGTLPRVGGRILINGTYELTDREQRLRRRYTYFLSGNTAFVVQCDASPSQWSSVLMDFDAMIASLQPSGSAPVVKTKPDKSAKIELKRALSALLGTFPSQWSCSLSDVAITSSSSKNNRTLEIALSFERSDIDEIYKATRTAFGIMKDGRPDLDLNSLPVDTQRAASNSGEFINYIGQVWGMSWGFVRNCNPAIERYKLPIIDSNGQRVGSISISREDASAILAGKVTASDAHRATSMYVFE